MPRLMIIAQESDALSGICSELVRSDFAYSILPHGNGLVEQITAQSPDLLLVETDGYLVNSRIRELAQQMKQERTLPVIALVSTETLDGIDGLDIDDFLASPYDAKELVLRVRRLLHKARIIDSSEVIKCDGLLIDLARCEATVEGKIVELTFKEYELLKLLASNRGRVYTREALLDKIWGYDYYGGDRTVDVHIRRLRSKIEDSTHTFIETVRNIGYRFKKGV